MARPNDAVEELLQEYADLISITGGDAFRARIYEKAARAIGGHPADVSTLDLDGLRKIPNVGRSIAEKVVEYFQTGRIQAVEELRTKIPPGLRELTAIPTLGPKKATVLYSELGIASVDELVSAIHEGRLEGLRGFGAKTAENLLRGVELMRSSGGRVLIAEAMSVAEEIVAQLSTVAGCERCAYAGSLRRMRETIGDIDILAAARKSEPLMRAFTRLSIVGGVIAS